MRYLFKCLIFTAITFLLQTTTTLLAQDRNPVPMPNSQRFTLYSSNTDYEYGIYVYLPSSYDREPNRVYPSLYILDGNTEFFYMGEIQRSLLWSNQIEEFIIVAIAYENQNMRGRDFSFTRSDGATAGSGAENFYTFITGELVPIIERDYRTSRSGRGLFGHSLGGGFTIWTMLTHTNAFDRYIISSPSLNGIDQIEAQYAAKHDDLPVACFMSVGEREGTALFARMVDILRSRAYPSFKLRDHIIADGVHGSVSSQCYSEGIRFVYDRAISLPTEKLDLYAGRYQADNVTIDIQFAGDHLIAITDRLRGATDLFPASETVFFTKGWPNDVAFTLGSDGIPQALTLSRITAAKIE